MKAKTAADLNSQHDDANLDRRYGKIGISAVAAALHYQSDARNPAYAPVVSQADNGWPSAKRRDPSQLVATIDRLG